MAKFTASVPDDLIKEIEKLEKSTEKMMGEMTKEAAKLVCSNVKANMQSSFKNASNLAAHLKISRTYKTPSDGGINNKVLFSGYYKNGTPVALIISAREFGTKRGEAKKPFFRKSFKKAQIESAMTRVQDKYIKG